MIEKRQDDYYIVNNTSVAITYKVEQLKNCTNFDGILAGTIEPGDEVLLVFTEDAEYKVILDNTEEFIILYYVNLQTSIICSINDILCGCDCECSSSSEFCDLLKLRAKIDVYKRLTNPYGVAFYDTVYDCVKCLITKPIYCSIAEELIRGESSCNEKLIKQIIALDYLAMYFYELAQVEDQEDIDFIKNKFKIEEIFCCIQKLGIDVGEIETKINNNMGNFTINSQSYVNLPPSQVGDNTISVANRSTTVLTLAMFTTQTTPVYTDPENDPVIDVRIDTLPADGELQLNGTPVTVGQVISVTDINNSLLTFVSPNQDALDSDTFTFSLRDSGSGQFSS